MQIDTQMLHAQLLVLSPSASSSRCNKLNIRKSKVVFLPLLVHVDAKHLNVSTSPKQKYAKHFAKF